MADGNLFQLGYGLETGAQEEDIIRGETAEIEALADGSRESVALHPRKMRLHLHLGHRPRTFVDLGVDVGHDAPRRERPVGVEGGADLLGTLVTVRDVEAEHRLGLHQIDSARQERP